VDTYAYGISGGDIVGDYYDGNAILGFLYDGSTYTTFNVFPGAIEETSVGGISGDNMVGSYFNGNTSEDEGFLYNGNTYTTLSVPGALATQASGISGDEIVGRYWDASGVLYGFLATPVPEPSALVLMAIGVIALLTRHQRFLAMYGLQSACIYPSYPMTGTVLADTITDTKRIKTDTDGLSSFSLNTQ
jgi:hypothetical protein